MHVHVSATRLDVLMYRPISNFFNPLAGPYIASRTFAVLFVLLWWIIVWVTDRRGWCLKI